MVRKTEENVIQKNKLRNTVLCFVCSEKMAMECRQVSTKVNGKTRERLGQSAKRSAAVRGQAGRGATVAGRRRPVAAEHKVGISSLPGFVAGRGPICFSSGSLPRIFPHVRDLSLQFPCFCISI
jgi:hypothetical protein